jgi:hypothetical protein
MVVKNIRKINFSTCLKNLKFLVFSEYWSQDIEFENLKIWKFGNVGIGDKCSMFSFQ